MPIVDITNLPAAPSRMQTPDAFVAAADAHVASLTTMVQQINAASDGMEQAEFNADQDAQAALASKLAAQAASMAAQTNAELAAGYAGAARWTAPTVYALDAVVFSPTNRMLYRRKSAGSSATDPVNDAGNWAPVVLGVGGNAVWHAGNFSPANYLPLAGGVVSGGLSVTGGVAFRFPDTRAVNDTPADKFAGGLSLGFKEVASVGLPPVAAAANYAHIVTLAGYMDATGGYPSQLSVGDGLAIRQGVSAGAWGPWRSVWHTGNLDPATLAPKANPLFSGHVQSLGQIRAVGWLGEGPGAANGIGVEIGASGGQGFINSYNRTASAYGLLNLQGAGINLTTMGSGATIDGYGVWHAGNFNPANFLPISGGALTGNLSMVKGSPVLALRHSGGTATSMSAYMSLQDGAGVERGWMGYGQGSTEMRLSNTIGIVNVQATGFSFNGSGVWHAGNVDPFRYVGWINAPGQDANTLLGNRSAFTYSNNAPHNGALVHFDAGGYGLQLNSHYSAGLISFRTRNGDTNAWTAWSALWHSGNFNPASYAALGASNTFDGYIETRSHFYAQGDYNVKNSAGNGWYTVISRNGGNPEVTATRFLAGSFVDFSDSNTRLARGFNTSLRVTSSYGYAEIGPQNVQYCHIMTDRPMLYSNKPLAVNGRVFANGDGTVGNGLGNVTVSTGTPTGGAQGDIWVQY